MELGRADAPGRPILYGTSVDFLERFGLLSLDDLPLLDADRRRAPRGAGCAGTRTAAAERRCTGPDEDADDDARRLRAARLMPAERLGKVLAAAGVASRRGADALVAAGRVTVDGRPAVARREGRPGAPGDRRRRPADRRRGRRPPVHLALHKPAGVTSTVADRHAARTVLDLVPPGLVPRGDAALSRSAGSTATPRACCCSRTTAPGPTACCIRATASSASTPWRSRAPLDGGQRAALAAGIPLEEGIARLVSLRPATRTETALLAGPVDPPPGRGLTWYRVILAHGWKRQIRRMLAAVGAPVVRLVRVRVGTLRLDLPSGGARLLTAAEVRRLAAPRPGVRPPVSSARGHDEEGATR